MASSSRTPDSSSSTNSFTLSGSTNSDMSGWCVSSMIMSTRTCCTSGDGRVRAVETESTLVKEEDEGEWRAGELVGEYHVVCEGE